jgi:hypothetical protein
MVKPKETRLSDKGDLSLPVFLLALTPFYLKIRPVSPITEKSGYAQSSARQ